MAYDMRWHDGGVEILWTGDVSAEELRRCAAHFAGTHRFDSLRWGLHDFTGCSSLAVNHTFMEEVAALVWAASRTNPNIRFAFIPDRADVQEMIASFNQAQIPSYAHHAFDQRADAIAWLTRKD